MYKKFTLFILTTILVIFVLDRGLALLFDSMYPKVKTGQTGGKINYYLSLTPTPELLIMGNSRAFYQVIPDSFDMKAYNLSHAGLSQIFQTGLLSILEQNNKLPKIILLHISIDEFFGNNKTIYDVQNLKYYYNKNELVTKYISEISDYEKFKYYFELYRYNGRVINLFKNYYESKKSDSPGNGYIAIPPTPSDSINIIYTTISHKAATVWGSPNSNFTFLNKFIEICSKEDVKLICFTTPTYTQIENYRKISFKLDSFLSSKEIPYINYFNQNIPLLESSPSFWKDVKHLNHNGAQVFSNDLNTRVKNILNDE